ncbi:hypothetical protein LWE61_09925 [Sphingobium sufflavum]|nr:hypothetical protein [Sphingobium sufflavum]MCE7796875.1 hypothetical protein [Sphingobium sufflavum]
MKILILLASTATTMASFATLGAAPPPAPRIISTTADGQPIILARMVVRD